jgi:hypothetical protein
VVNLVAESGRGVWLASGLRLSRRQRDKGARRPRAAGRESLARRVDADGGTDEVAEAQACRPIIVGRRRADVQTTITRIMCVHTFYIPGAAL